MNTEAKPEIVKNADTRPPRVNTVAYFLYEKMQAAYNCRERGAGNPAYPDRHYEAIGYLVRNFLPHGSGFDSGVEIDMDDHRDERLILTTSFHHMNETGFYVGWTDHTVTVRPGFNGLNVTVSGKNRNDIKTYIREMFHTCLSTKVREMYSEARGVWFEHTED